MPLGVYRWHEAYRCLIPKTKSAGSSGLPQGIRFLEVRFSVTSIFDCCQRAKALVELSLSFAPRIRNRGNSRIRRKRRTRFGNSHQSHIKNLPFNSTQFATLKIGANFGHNPQDPRNATFTVPFPDRPIGHCSRGTFSVKKSCSSLQPGEST